MKKNYKAMDFEPFKIKNTIEPLNTNVTREQAVAESGEKTIRELENYWGF